MIPLSPRLRPWALYVGAFYVLWLVLAFGYGMFAEILARWPISLVMILGSLVAGSTPMGGGTVAFPFLVLGMGHTPQTARNFGLAIQALGMTSAMIFVFCRGVPVQRRVLGWAALGSAAGILLGAFVLAPYLSANQVRLIFACLWMSFAVLTLAKNREICAMADTTPVAGAAACRSGLVAGFAGGIITAMTGVGVEMMLYTSLVLLYRRDLKIAIPTAVSGMAVASLFGAGVYAAAGAFDREVLLMWLAAGPIVVFGAPTGTFLVSVIPRIRTLYFVALLCVVQFGWALWRVRPGPGEWGLIAGALLLAGAAFYLMYRRGLAGRRQAPASAVLAAHAGQQPGDGRVQ